MNKKEVIVNILKYVFGILIIGINFIILYFTAFVYDKGIFYISLLFSIIFLLLTFYLFNKIKKKFFCKLLIFFSNLIVTIILIMGISKVYCFIKANTLKNNIETLYLNQNLDISIKDFSSYKVVYNPKVILKVATKDLKIKYKNQDTISDIDVVTNFNETDFEIILNGFSYKFDKI